MRQSYLYNLNPYSWKGGLEMEMGFSFKRKLTAPSGRFYQHGLTLIPAWISNHAPSIVWDEIAYPFPNFTGTTIEA